MMKLKTHLFMIVAFLFCWAVVLPAQSKPLDIIIGGKQGGLECKKDSDCSQGYYCHQEQYYCEACSVPPKVWTGTTCMCPANKPVSKSETECVECLQNSDCKGDNQFCNTETDTCQQCVPPKQWIDNACVCPDKSHAVGDSCVCDNPNEAMDDFNFCTCTLTPANCATTDLNLTECMCCPPERPVNVGSDCKPCSEIDSTKPVWDSVAKKCVECLYDRQCPSSKPKCDTDTNTCVQCKVTAECVFNQYCNNMKCTPCPSNQVRPAGEQNCRCPDNLPHWNGTRCVQCQSNWNCPANQYCSNNTCVGCPPNQIRPTNEENCRCDSSRGYYYQNGTCVNDCVIQNQSSWQSFSFPFVTEHFLWVIPSASKNQVVLSWMDTWSTGSGALNPSVAPNAYNGGRHNYDNTRGDRCNWAVFRNNDSGSMATHLGTRWYLPEGASVKSIFIERVEGTGCHAKYNIYAPLNQFSFLTVCPSGGMQTGTIWGTAKIDYTIPICPVGGGMKCNASNKCSW